MNIYISHCGGVYDYEKELYKPIKGSDLAKEYYFFLPHELENLDTDAVTELKRMDVLVAESSFPSTGQGIELAQAKAAGVPIICFYKTGAEISSSLRFVTNSIIEYTDMPDFFVKLSAELERISQDTKSRDT